ncbi:tRNA (adenosine(37)-N6)-threonylcarbamoyltransferase complex dimerization subunit type 1 TsaB [Roseivirga misakiensis]|uniref:tRNA N6-adenosine(37)-N6-threonylcarbamoyltransferase complex dimerization subunit TsaB n=1 Tax=Roseivirga misakiensis TaxID=1563681 RepID=A0A1E5T4D8_9BACT|nr:tRNA (adenosine(37)-N6)-threonylcarbamoyltransferase complex dimerization subunit type 1 TsaB [Roseivirga misakiensis]OEK06191.1 tRNA N6-adenosine(37)-N6-threonylcarbamoyltransferase complex dimerization subunit TsaB [Roseivirga misakiensis]
MALILSIETSTTVCSIAITDGNDVVATQKLFLEKSHSNLLTVIIQDTLKQCGLELGSFSAIAVSEGPGSYTGLRIGVSTAKGICYALDKPLIAIPTLAALAHEVNTRNTEKFHLAPMLDARRMEVYTALFDSDLNTIQEVAPMILDEQSFLETLREKTVLFFGGGSNKFEPLVEGGANARFINDITPSAWAVGQLAYQKCLSESFEDVAYFEPFYLKAFRATVPKPLL